jgi:putative membrane protein
MIRDWCTKASLAAIALCLAVPAARAQASLSDGDRTFVTKAAESGYAEVATGKAAAKSDNQAIRDFGNQMVDEHSKMNDELASIAKQKGVTPPTSADLASKAKNALMNVLPGKTFDKQYVSSQLDDHQETLQLMQKEAQSGQDPDLKAFAQKSVPVIQKHIDELHDLQKRPELQ